MYGWICSKCQRINAPTTATCPCSVSLPFPPYPGWAPTWYPEMPYRQVTVTNGLGEVSQMQVNVHASLL